MAKWSNEKMADLTRKLADTAIDYKQRCEELEAKLAQQDDLVQAAVAAALRKAADAVREALRPSAGRAARATILSLITEDAQAALDRVVAAERERCAKVAEGQTAGPYFRLPAFHGADGCASDESEVAQAARAIAAAIREGGE